MCVCNVEGRYRLLVSAALWLFLSLVWGSLSGYSIANHSKPGCLPFSGADAVQFGANCLINAM